MKQIKVKDNTYYVRAKFIDVGLYFINERECILIDSGFHKTAKNEIIPFLQENNLLLKGVICTHGHVDHSGGNHILKSTFDAKIAVPYVENMLCENDYNMYVLTDNLRFKIFSDSLPAFRYNTDVVVHPERKFLLFNDVTFRVIKLYGHSPYQAGYITPDNVAYLGDSLISQDMIKRTKLPYVFDVAKDLETKNFLRTLECDYYILSHEGVYEDIHNLIDKNIQHLNSRMEILLDLLKEPSSFDNYTGNIINAMGIDSDLRKVVYINRIVRSYLSYFQDAGMVDAFIDHNQIHFVRK